MLSLMALCTFTGNVTAQSGGSAFSNPATAGQNETKITVDSDKNITIDEVYYYDTTDSEWKPIEGSEFAIKPNGPAKIFDITFINGLVGDRQYRIKYSWTASQDPVVTIDTE
jgi:hypothetical protein